MKRPDGRGHYETVCSECGCPGHVTQVGPNPENKHIVWAYDTAETNRQRLEIANAMLDTLPPSQLAILRAEFDPAFAAIERWCADTAQTAEIEEDDDD